MSEAIERIKQKRAQWDLLAEASHKARDASAEAMIELDDLLVAACRYKVGDVIQLLDRTDFKIGRITAYGGQLRAHGEKRNKTGSWSKKSMTVQLRNPDAGA